MGARSFAPKDLTAAAQDARPPPASLQMPARPLFAKNDYPKTISLTIYSVIFIVCLASLSVFLILFAAVQLTSNSRPGKLSKHDYRPLLNQDQPPLSAGVELSADEEMNEISRFEHKA